MSGTFDIGRGAVPPAMTVEGALLTRRAALDTCEAAMVDRNLFRTQLEQAQLFLASIATADPQGDQGKWMVEQARQGLERSGKPLPVRGGGS